MDWHYSVFWIVLILKFTLGEHCNETLNTVRNVSSCPLNKEEWQAAAKRMDCSKIKMTKNCENVTYHCLRHAVTKKMVEVCTVPRNLKGFCPHFYEDQPYVRDDYKRDCSSSSMCLPFYSSKDAYNYSACYNTSIPTTISSSDVLKPTSVTTVQNIHVSADGISKETGKSNNTWIWILLVVIFLLIVVVYIIAVAWVTKSKRKSVREALCLHQHIFEGCRKDTQIGKDGTENEDSEKADEKISLIQEENIEGNTGTCDKRNINEGKTYEKDVSPESEKETTFHQTDEKSSVEVDLENKSSIKSLTQKDDFIEGGTSSNKELDTFSNNANQTADKTTDLQLRDAKEPMGSDSTEEKRAPIGEDIKTTAELPQNGNKMETPPTERKVPIAGGSVDEDKEKNPNPGCRRKNVGEEKGEKKKKRIRDLQLTVDELMRVMTNLCGKGRIYYAEKDISDMEVEMTLIENRSSNPMAKCKEIEEEIKEIETRLAPIEEKINELKYEVEDDEEFGMPIQESDKRMAEMKNSLPASNEERYNMSGFSNEVVAFTDEEDKQEDKQENYQKEYTNETTEKIVLKKKDPEKVKWSGSFPGNLWNEGCGDNTVTDKDSDPKQQKNPGRLEILESKIKELKEEIRQLGEDIHSVTGVGILHNTEKKIKQLNQDVTLLGSMIKGNMNNLEERIKNFEERVNQLQENINTQRENQRKIFDSVDIQKNCESDSL